MEGNLVMTFLKIGLVAFGAEQLFKMIGKGEYVPYIRIAGLGSCIGLALTEVAKILKQIMAFSNM